MTWSALTRCGWTRLNGVRQARSERRAVTRVLSIAIAFFALASPGLAQAPSAPYAGQQARAIKSLSAEEIASLLKGEGIGLAKAAELNGYPGPAHVLALAGELRLSDAQRRQVQSIFDRM